MPGTTKTLAHAALCLALAAGWAGTAQAFGTDRASWINHLHEQRRAQQGEGAERRTAPAPRTEAARQARTPVRPAARPGVRPVTMVAPRTRTRQMDPQFLPRQVAYDGPHRPGTVVIDTSDKFLYLVGRDGTARRYGVGVGREGFQWTGRHRITMKREWPGWTPPPAMRRRQPDLPAYMPGGPENPLGARALYLGSTLYRIHGSNAPWTIGHAVSSGCIRMRNEDVIDLYGRVGVGTMVVVQR